MKSGLASNNCVIDLSVHPCFTKFQIVTKGRCSAPVWDIDYGRFITLETLTKQCFSPSVHFSPEWTHQPLFQMLIYGEMDYKVDRYHGIHLDGALSSQTCE